MPIFQVYSIRCVNIRSTLEIFDILRFPMLFICDYFVPYGCVWCQGSLQSLFQVLANPLPNPGGLIGYQNTPKWPQNPNFGPFLAVFSLLYPHITPLICAYYALCGWPIYRGALQVDCSVQSNPHEEAGQDGDPRHLQIRIWSIWLNLSQYNPIITTINIHIWVF